MDSPPGGETPGDPKSQVGVQPANNRLAEVTYPAEREYLHGQVQYKALVQFDAPEIWRVRIHIQSARGSGEALATVEATPPGYGRWDLLIYTLPFLAVGLLWFVAVWRKRSRKQAEIICGFRIAERGFEVALLAKLQSFIH